MLRLDWNLLFTIINLLIIYFLMKRFLFAPVNKILAERKKDIEKQYTDAEAVQEKALELKAQYEKSVDGAEVEKENILLEAKEKASAEYDRILLEAKENADKLVEEAQHLAELEQKRRIRQAQGQIVDLVVAAAAKITAVQGNEEADKELYNKFLAKAGEEVD